ncbi:lipopolysaccharide assembly protein LapB [Pleionea sp. CnH1-48]|uniref:tetratricopeptide repeat protein n=1 Tax=Pleionea sp. CnH1-48 TaxID=2954494 RepID=UPI002096B689|nr:tetratricopeptide repeat protein [Pleionea sp. CnH1-48]MCO7223121.1 hypothetical protein [Pleionea sp. CnH1-48]
MFALIIRWNYVLLLTVSLVSTGSLAESPPPAPLPEKVSTDRNFSFIRQVYSPQVTQALEQGNFIVAIEQLQKIDVDEKSKALYLAPLIKAYELNESIKLHERKHNYQQAIALIDIALKQNDHLQSPLTYYYFTAKKEALQKAESDHLKSSPGTYLWNMIVTSFKPYLNWILWLAFFFILTFLVRRFNPVKKTVLLNLKDLSDNHNDAEQKLADQFIQEFHSLLSDTYTSDTINRAIELDDSGMITDRSDSTVLTQTIDILDNTPVKLGPFSFSPKQLFLLLSTFFERKDKTEFVGALSQDSEHTFMWVEQRTSTEVKRFQAKASGDGARASVIRQISAQMALSVATKSYTDNWRSLHAYLESKVLLEQAQESQNRLVLLNQAVQTLQSAIRLDPANHLARFRLASIYASLRRFGEAADQFEFIYRLYRREVVYPNDEDNTFTAIANQIDDDELPLFWVVIYNWLMSMTLRALESKSVNRLSGSLRNTQRFIAHLTPIAETSPQANSTLYLAKAVQALAHCVNQEIHRFSKQHVNQLEESLKIIESNEKFLWNAFREAKSECLEALGQAHCIAQNALGRTYYLRGNLVDSERYLAWSISIHMPPNYIDPYVNLASFYIKHQRSFRKANWVLEARRCLERALALQPTHSKANYLLAKLYSGAPYYQQDKAIAILEQLPEDAGVLFLLAQIYMEQGETSRDKAFQLLEDSIKIDSTADARYTYFLEQGVESLNTRQEGPSRQRLEQLAKHIEKHGIAREYRQAGESFALTLQQRLSENSPAY